MPPCLPGVARRSIFAGAVVRWWATIDPLDGLRMKADGIAERAPLARLADQQVLRVEASNEADTTRMVVVGNPDPVVLLALNPGAWELHYQIEQSPMHVAKPGIDEHVPFREVVAALASPTDAFTAFHQRFESTPQRLHVVDLGQRHACPGS